MNRVLQMRSDVITAVSTISVVNGYRTTLRGTVGTTLLDIASLTLLPQASVILGEEHIKAASTSRSVWDSELDVAIIGYTFLKDLDALSHDLERVMAQLSLQYLNTSNDQWAMVRRTPLFTVDHMHWDGLEKGWVELIFGVAVMKQNNTFTN